MESGWIENRVAGDDLGMIDDRPLSRSPYDMPGTSRRKDPPPLRTGRRFRTRRRRAVGRSGRRIGRCDARNRWFDLRARSIGYRIWCGSENGVGRGQRNRRGQCSSGYRYLNWSRRRSASEHRRCFLNARRRRRIRTSTGTAAARIQPDQQHRNCDVENSRMSQRYISISRSCHRTIVRSVRRLCRAAVQPQNSSMSIVRSGFSCWS